MASDRDGEPENILSGPGSSDEHQTVAKLKPKRHRKPAAGDWVRAERIAEMFDVSVSAVYHGHCATDQIRSAVMGLGPKPSRRWYLPDAIALKERMLAQATARQEQMTAPLRWSGERRQRRRR